MTRTRREVEADINGCKQLLAETDYKALKHADGVLDEAEWEPVKDRRKELRQQINDFEAELEDAPDDDGE